MSHSSLPPVTQRIRATNLLESHRRSEQGACGFVQTVNTDPT
jgi:hypothetical protein